MVKRDFWPINFVYRFSDITSEVKYTDSRISTKIEILKTTHQDQEYLINRKKNFEMIWPLFLFISSEAIQVCGLPGRRSVC